MFAPYTRLVPKQSILTNYYASQFFAIMRILSPGPVLRISRSPEISGVNRCTNEKKTALFFFMKEKGVKSSDLKKVNIFAEFWGSKN